MHLLSTYCIPSTGLGLVKLGWVEPHVYTQQDKDIIKNNCEIYLQIITIDVDTMNSITHRIWGEHWSREMSSYTLNIKELSKKNTSPSFQ